MLAGYDVCNCLGLAYGIVSWSLELLVFLEYKSIFVFFKGWKNCMHACFHLPSLFLSFNYTSILNKLNSGTKFHVF